MDLTMHLPTLLMTSILINGLIGGMLWAIYRLRNRERCFQYWAFACLVFVAGSALAILQTFQNTSIILAFAAHVLLGLSPLLLLAGIHVLMDLPALGTRRSAGLCYWAGSVYVLGLLVGLGQDPIVGRFLTALFSAMIFSLAIYRLGAVERKPKLPLRILQTLFAVHGVLMMTQVLVIALSSQAGATWLESVLKLILINHLLLVSATALALPLLAFTRSEQALVALAERDGLTQLLNRRAFDREGKLAFEKAQAEGSLITVLMIDLDHFKQINDRWGHAVGDDVLKAVAGLLATELRDDDILGRVGGEEFAAVLHNKNREAVEVVTRRLLQRITEVGREVQGAPVQLSASIGGTTLAPEHRCFREVLEAADKALYRAKHNGRNRAELVLSAGGVTS